MEPCDFDTLFSKNVPHLLEKIFFFLDYKSYKTCLEVNIIWKDLLTSSSFQRKGKSVFHKEILADEIELWHVAKEGDKDKVSKILATGMVNVDSSFSHRLSMSALASAAFFGQTDVVQLLFDREADINKTDIFGKTPIHNAAKNGKIDTVRLLIELGADPSLPKAVAHDEEAIVRMLLQAGVNINMTDSDGHTALSRAAWSGRADIVQFLLKRGAKPNKGAGSGDTPLHVAAHCGNINVAKQLIDKGADPNRKNIWGSTPLIQAVQSNKINMVKYLVTLGADQNIANDYKTTPLRHAHRLGYSDIVNFLTERQHQPQQLPQQQLPQQQQHQQQQQHLQQHHPQQHQQQQQGQGHMCTVQ